MGESRRESKIIETSQDLMRIWVESGASEVIKPTTVRKRLEGHPGFIKVAKQVQRNQRGKI